MQINLKKREPDRFTQIFWCNFNEISNKSTVYHLYNVYIICTISKKLISCVSDPQSHFTNQGVENKGQT